MQHTGEHTADDLRDRMAEAIARLVKSNRHGQLCPIWTQRRTEPPIGRCNCWILPDARKQADAAFAEVTPEMERLRAELAEVTRVRDNLRTAYEACQRNYRKVVDQLNASCTCDPNPETTQGPEEDCPVHGRDEYRPLALIKRVEGMRRMAQVWIDICPQDPTEPREVYAMAYAGQQILAALDTAHTPEATP
jgi:hypothetical protein